MQSYQRLLIGIRRGPACPLARGIWDLGGLPVRQHHAVPRFVTSSLQRPLGEPFLRQRWGEAPRPLGNKTSVGSRETGFAVVVASDDVSTCCGERGCHEPCSRTFSAPHPPTRLRVIAGPSPRTYTTIGSRFTRETLIGPRSVFPRSTSLKERSLGSSAYFCFPFAWSAWLLPTSACFAFSRLSRDGVPDSLSFSFSGQEALACIAQKLEKRKSGRQILD